MCKKICFFVLLLCMTTQALASAQDGGWYVGFQFGESDSSNDSLSNLIKGASSMTTGPAKQTTDTGGLGWRPHFGYLFNGFFGLEVGFAAFADTEYKNALGIPGYNITLSPRATDFVAKVAFPISDFNIYAKLGVAYLEQSLSFDSKTVKPTTITDIPTLQALASGAAINASNNDEFVGVFGIGAGYFINKSWSADLSWTRYEGSSSVPSFDLVALGITYYLC